MSQTSTYHYDDGLRRFDYTIILKPRLKHRYIRIRHGQVVVTAASGTAEGVLREFVASQAAWIVRHLDAVLGEEVYDLSRPSAQLYWRGDLYPIAITHGPNERLEIASGVATFTVRAPADHATLLGLLHWHHKQHAPAILLPRVHHWAAIMDLHPTRVSFRRARTRWGSCSSRDTLSLNTHLLMLPDPLIDHIIIHELAHIRHKNHSRDFWDLVGRYDLDWRTHRRMIRPYEHYLR